MKSDAHFQNLLPRLQLGVEVLPGETQRLGHGGVDLSARVLGGDELVGLVE